MNSNTLVTKAIVRQVSRSLGRCELLHVTRQPFDLDTAIRQHADYVAALETAGVSVVVLNELADWPDATFVEDTMVVLDEIAVICRPGAVSRRQEPEQIAPEIARFRPLRNITAPGTLEGGDVLRIGKKLFVGNSTRTNVEGIRQLKQIVAPYGYEVMPVKVKGCLHLKTGVTAPREDLLVVNPAWIEMNAFRGFDILPVPPEEPWAANTLFVNGMIIVAEGSPHTAECLEAKGVRVRRVEISELQKAEAGVTCLSVLIPTPPSASP